jgi:hypothetical protein
VPEVDADFAQASKSLKVTIKRFHRGGLDPDDAAELEDAGRGDLAMALVDTNYDGHEMRLDEYRFGDELAKAEWTFSIDLSQAGKKILLSFMDVHGNELRQVIELAMDGKKPARNSKAVKAKTKTKAAQGESAKAKTKAKAAQGEPAMAKTKTGSFRRSFP